jgi:bidirectional [NiFe] hydrogenase diaphorase subunit
LISHPALQGRNFFGFLRVVYGADRILQFFLAPQLAMNVWQNARSFPKPAPLIYPRGCIRTTAQPQVTPMNATSAKPQKKRLQAALEHASGDQFRHDALIEVLHKAQELFGYLEDDLLLFVAYKLKLPPSRVYGVATFYHFFTLKPKGEHTCVVCMGTACYVRGADKVISAIEQEHKIKPGETTPDNKVSLLTARCIGACGIAPAVVYDGTVTPRATPASAVEQIKKWKAQ